MHRRELRRAGARPDARELVDPSAVVDHQKLEVDLAQTIVADEADQLVSQIEAEMATLFAGGDGGRAQARAQIADILEAQGASKPVEVWRRD